jgi:site-specific DNA recombinase
VRTLDIYTRVSHKSDKKVLSTHGQERRCRLRVERVGAQVGLVFSDPERSAWNTRVRRPGWEALMARLESGESDGVVVFDLARFARRPADGERLITAAERGVSILDSGTEYDLMSASGRKNFREQMNSAAYYSDIVSDSARSGKLDKAHRGEVDARRSFGFEPDGVTVRTDEAKIIRDHAKRLLAGETQDVLISELRATGVPTVRGAEWGYTTYRQVMTRPRNVGLIVHKGEVVPGVRLPGEPILDQPTYDRVVALYAARKRGRPPSGRYLLTGLAFCGLCEAPLGGRPVSGSDRRHYWCKKCRRISVDVRRLDEWVGDWAIRILSDPQHADAIEQAERELADQRAQLTDEAASIEATLVEIAGRLGRREISLARHDAVAEPLDARLAEIATALAELSATEPLPPTARTLPARDVQWLTWLERWDSGIVSEQRGMVVRALNGRKLIVGPGQSARFDEDRLSIV